MTKIFKVIDKKTKKVLYEDTSLTMIGKFLNVTHSTAYEHYRDRNNPRRFSSSEWRIIDDNDK